MAEQFRRTIVPAMQEAAKTPVRVAPSFARLHARFPSSWSRWLWPPYPRYRGPEHADLREEQSPAAASNDLLRSFNLARSTALLKQKDVVVCATSDPKADKPTCSYGAFRGWIVFLDSNSNWQADDTEELYERHEVAGHVAHRQDR